MIIRERPPSWQLVFIMRGSVIPKIWPQIIAASLFGSLIQAGNFFTVTDTAPLSMAPFAIVGIALSLFLGFKNNAAYERWWEARCCWGEIIAETRSMARSTELLLGPKHPMHKQILNNLVVFAYALKRDVSNRKEPTNPSKFLTDDQKEQDGSYPKSASIILQQIAAQIQDIYKRRDIDTIGLQILNDRLHGFGHAQAATERIHSTPMPFAYSLLIRRTTYIYCFLLPFGLTASASWLTPLFSAIAAYVFFGLNALSEELENPFNNNINSLPLDALCRTIEISVAEALHEPPPKPLIPEEYNLT